MGFFNKHSRPAEYKENQAAQAQAQAQAQTDAAAMNRRRSMDAAVTSPNSASYVNRNTASLATTAEEQPRERRGLFGGMKERHSESRAERDDAALAASAGVGVGAGVGHHRGGNHVSRMEEISSILPAA